MSEEPTPDTVIKLGKHIVQQPGRDGRDRLLLLLLWGMSGCGKTTLAATAPGKKLWLSFDPEATASLGSVPEGELLDIPLSDESSTILEQWRRANPNRIEEFIRTNGIETVVLDSVTTLVDMATENAVNVVKSATLDNPGMKGYQHRNAITMQILTQIMKSCIKCSCNFIVIGHEDAPQLTDDGHISAIVPLIGGKMVNGVPLRLGEVWHMENVKGKRRIQIMPVRVYKPMKTRMFSTMGDSEFDWKFNQDQWTGMKISDWLTQWKESGWKKIPLPN
tara:strand:- start:1211 stop:2041 length:831 start_codon:yes stop_codon:yes gene_type:complete